MWFLILYNVENTRPHIWMKESSMSSATENFIKKMLEDLEQISHIPYEDIPNIDLYMDQVTTFMEERLQVNTRKPGEDKILTKTMINNYAKSHILPAPVKKKYSREHMMVLIMIYYLKGVLSFQDIQELLRPITDCYFDAEENSVNLEKIYKELFYIEETQKKAIKEDILQKAKRAGDIFADAKQEDRQYLEMFSLVVQLGLDVYVKRLLMERLLDEYCAKQTEQDAVKNKKKEPKTE